MSTELRDEFIRLLTVDGPTHDRRRREYNQAIFFPAEHPSFPGYAVFTGTDLEMVMWAFDRAVANLRRRQSVGGAR